MVRSLYRYENLLLSEARSLEEGDEHADELDRKKVHFYFCVKGHTVFSFGGHYTRSLEAEHSYLLYSPDKDIPYRMALAPHTDMVFLSLSLKDMHTLFLGHTLHFLTSENTDHRYHEERPIPMALMVALNQLLTIDLEAATQKLYYRGKVMEILSLYFSEKKPNTENCPFLNDQEIVRKIKRAKEFLLKNDKSPPRLKELARHVGLNEYQLKVGFKHTYGNTVYGFLLHHKLDRSHYLLTSGKHKVNEVASLIGYSNISHFISAFKKRFGVTPKKYMMQQER